MGLKRKERIKKEEKKDMHPNILLEWLGCNPSMLHVGGGWRYSYSVVLDYLSCIVNSITGWARYSGTWCWLDWNNGIKHWLFLFNYWGSKQAQYMKKLVTETVMKSWTLLSRDIEE